MVHKSSTARGKPVQLVDARQAAESAFDYFRTLFTNGAHDLSVPGSLDQKVSAPSLEEIEMSKDGRYWLVTLGFDQPRANNPRLPKFLHVPFRTLKVFKVDAATGRVLSMKIPHDE